MADEQPIWEEKYKQLEDQYRKDMGLAYQALQQQQPQQQQPEEPLWDTSDPQKLKGQIEDSLRKTVVDTLSPVVTHFSGNQFESNLSILKADARFPYAGKWENEIRQLAQQVPAALLGKPETVSGLIVWWPVDISRNSWKRKCRNVLPHNNSRPSPMTAAWRWMMGKKMKKKKKKSPADPYQHPNRNRNDNRSR